MSCVDARAAHGVHRLMAGLDSGVHRLPPAFDGGVVGMELNLQAGAQQHLFAGGHGGRQVGDRRSLK